MPQKTKIIFISAFIITGVIILGWYFYTTKQTTPTTTIGSIAQKFNPFGSSKTVNNNGGDGESATGEQTAEEQENIINSRFHQVTTFAVSGATFFEEIKTLPAKEKVEVTTNTEATVDTPTTPVKTAIKTVVKKTAVTPTPAPEPLFELVPSLRYVERATGHVYQMYIDGWTESKIANSTIPGVYETMFDVKANSIIYRYFSPINKTISSFLVQLGGSAGRFLAPNITEMGLSPNKDKFFSIVKNANGSIGYVGLFNENKTTQIFTSPFSEWLSQWATEKNIFLTTKPSYLVNGTVFSLNISNGVLSKVFGGVPGLTTLASNDGSNILYGASLDTGPTLNIFNVKNHTSKDLGKYGLPEKCIWNNDNVTIYCAVPNTIVGTQYPDSWYQGIVSFSDSFISININTGEVSTLANSETETPVDATKMFLSKGGDKLFFINKKDGTLWSFNL